jgi:hypothetical protein
MQCLQIPISCMVFMMEILSLHWGNISISIWIVDSLTDMCLKLRIIIWRKHACLCQMPMLAVEDKMCRMRGMCWISYTVTLQPALVRFFLQQDLLRVQYGLLYGRISCVISLYNQCNGWIQETNISVLSSHDWCYTGLWMCLNFCITCCLLMRHYL